MRVAGESNGRAMTSRRDFVKAAAAAAVSAIPSAASGGQAASVARANSQNTNSQNSDLLRPPDHVTARFGPRAVAKMQYSAAAWTCPAIRVSAEPTQTGHSSELPVRVTNEGKNLTYLHIRWEGRESEGLLSIGDAWERSYGDLEWRGVRVSKLAVPACDVQYCPTKASIRAPCFAFNPLDSLRRQFQV